MNQRQTFILVLIASPVQASLRLSSDHRIRYAILRLASIAFLSLAGCVSPSFRGYDATQVSSLLGKRQVQEVAGLRVTIDPVVDQDRCEQIFSAQPLAHGLIPIFIRVENVTAIGPILVEQEKFVVSINPPAGGEGVPVLAGDQMAAINEIAIARINRLPGKIEVAPELSESVALAAQGLTQEQLAVAFAPLSPVVLYQQFGMFDAVSDADAIRHNFIRKEFRNQSVTPGKTAEGFFYVLPQSTSDTIRKLLVSLPLKNMLNDEWIVVSDSIEIPYAKSK